MSTVWGGNGSGGTTVTETFPLIGAVSIQALALNSSRKSLEIQNNSAARTLFVNFKSAATVACRKLGPGGTPIKWDNPDSVPTDAVFIIGDGAFAANDVVVLEGQ